MLNGGLRNFKMSLFGKKKDKPLFVINWKPTPELQLMKECECGQPCYTSKLKLQEFYEKYGSKPKLICVVCAIKKYAYVFDKFQIMEIKKYYAQITN